MKPPEVVRGTILDFDDTLLATRERRTDLIIRAARDLGYEITPETIAPHWGKPFNRLVKGFLPTVDYKAFYAHYRKLMREVPPKVLPGVRRLLRTLASNGVATFVISSGSRDLVVQDLRVARLEQFFTRLWGFEDTRFHKPNPKVMIPVLSALKKMKIPRDGMIYFGDGISDYEVASLNRIFFCAVTSGSNSRDDFRLAGLEDAHIIDSFDQLFKTRSWFLDSVRLNSHFPRAAQSG